jgi:beta-lactamase regulating signal transducer with metallopeptidase domain
MLTWFAVVVGQVLRLVGQRIRLARLLKQSVPIVGKRGQPPTKLRSAPVGSAQGVLRTNGDCPLFPEELAALVVELAQEIGLRRVPAAVSVAGDCPLFVCGLWQPRLVLPSRLLAALSGAERRQVILHELAHIKRHDLIWGWPVEIARTVYFFHPLVWWAAYQMRLERELACDQLAMARSGHPPADYAQTLVQVVSHASEPAVIQAAAISAGLTGGKESK